LKKDTHFWHDALLVSAHILLSLLVFIIIISVIVFLFRKTLRQYKHIDLSIFDKVSRIENKSLTRFMLFITFLGKHQFLIPANLIVLFYFLLIRHHSWLSVRIAAISLSSLVLMLVLKKLFRRKRPLEPLLHAVRGLSFPSGHAIMAVSFFGLIIYIINNTAGNSSLITVLTILLVIMIFLIGFSRIYLRVHYASDVLSGFIIGTSWLLISLSILSKLELLRI
jgi:membrane-associated phospholipid phosphatase